VPGDLIARRKPTSFPNGAGFPERRVSGRSARRAYFVQVLVKKAPTRNVGALLPAILVPGFQEECMRAAVYCAKAHDLAGIIDPLGALEIPA
jgi:hypothetical protein